MRSLSVIVMFVLTLLTPFATAAERVGRGSVAAISREEAAVRAAYTRLASYNRASYAPGLGRNEALADDLALRFELRDFRTGWIDERRSDFFADLVTPAGGEVIVGTRTGVRQKTGAETLAYAAAWQPIDGSSLHDSYVTVGEMLARAGSETADIGRYTSYEVTVLFEGKSRTYRALAVYHDRYDRDNDVQPQFLDEVVGLAGTLTELARDHRAPFRGAVIPPKARAVQSDDRLDTDTHNLGVPNCFGIAPPHDNSDHWPGSYHTATGWFCNECGVADSTGVEGEAMHYCSAQATIEPVEQKDFAEKLQWGYHLPTPDVKVEIGKTVPATQEVSCEAAAAVVFKGCDTPFCSRASFTLGINGKGASAQATLTVSGDAPLWSYASASGITCPAAESTGNDITTRTGGGGGGDGPDHTMDHYAPSTCWVSTWWIVVNGVKYVISETVLFCE